MIAAFGQTPALAPHLPLAEGAESWITLVQRTGRELEAIVRRHYGETVMVVGHEETVVAAAQHFLQLLPWSRAEVTFGVDFTSQTVWQRERLSWCDPEAERWRWRLVRANDVGHLGRRSGRHRCMCLERDVAVSRDSVARIGVLCGSAGFPDRGVVEEPSCAASMSSARAEESMAVTVTMLRRTSKQGHPTILR